MTLLDVVARRRLDSGERIRHDAFVDEITTRWRPTSGRDRLLQRRAQLVHASIRLFGGGPTLVQVAVASSLLALGMMLRAIAPAPNNPSYTVSAPEWARAVLVAGLLTLAVEAFRSPRRIRKRRSIALAVAPIPIVQLWMLVTSPLPDWPNWPARFAATVVGVAIALVICAARLRSRLVLRVGLMVAVGGAGALGVAEALRVGVYVSDDDPVLAAASLLFVVGCTLVAAGLLRTRVELAP